MANCVICGKPAALLDKQCLSGTVCKNCMSKLPEIITYKLKDYRAETLRALLIDENLKENAAIFSETASFGDLHIDENHGLFCICNNKKMKRGKVDPGYRGVFDSVYVSDFGISLKPYDAQEAAVYCCVNFYCVIDRPKISFNAPIKNKAGCMAHRVDKEHITYKEPGDLTLIKNIFYEMRLKKIKRFNDEFAHHFLSKESIDRFVAQNIMMLSDDYTRDELKKQRNRLLKVYHPDESKLDENMEFYTQKINNAYNLLRT